MKHPSTTLPQTSDPKENQKAVLDLLAKINLLSPSILELNQTDYTEKQNDGWSMLSVTTGSVTRKVVLLASNKANLRSRLYSKADSAAGELKLQCQGSDVIKYPGGTSTSVYVGLQNQSVELLGVSGGFLIIRGVVQPVAGEPDIGGGWHKHIAIVLNTNPTDAIEHSLDLSSDIPSGANNVHLRLIVASATTAGRTLVIRGTSGAATADVVAENANTTTNGRADGNVAISSRTVYWIVSDADVSNATINTIQYALGPV